MSTTIHLPKGLLDALDRRARKLKVSRNALIVEAIRKELDRRTEWAVGFFDDLLRVEEGDGEAVEEMLRAIRSRRTRKGPVAL